MADMAHPPSFNLPAAWPFWASIALLPIVGIAASFGGWTLLLVPLSTWWLFGTLDAAIGSTDQNADPNAPDSAIRWHMAVTLLWPALQLVLIFGTIAFTADATHLVLWEKIALAGGIGVLTGAIGINYAHELMHQKSRLEGWLADILMTSVLYGHFRSEHLLVHHRYVGTPRDYVTAKKGQNFHRSLFPTLWGCLKSAWQAEVTLLARRALPAWHRRNPFWRYGLMQVAFALLAYGLGGAFGLAMFGIQAAVAVWQLELVNFVEHYGLTRKYLGDGKYEHVKPRHSWNNTRKASNWLLINLQRHSDHHFKPGRRFPLLQTYGEDEAPELPFGYPVMTILALMPPLWRHVMDPRVKAWRKRFYPEIEDWMPYNKGTNPMPR